MYVLYKVFIKMHTEGIIVNRWHERMVVNEMDDPGEIILHQKPSFVVFLIFVSLDFLTFDKSMNFSGCVFPCPAHWMKMNSDFIMDIKIV